MTIARCSGIQLSLLLGYLPLHPRAVGAICFNLLFNFLVPVQSVPAVFYTFLLLYPPPPFACAT